MRKNHLIWSLLTIGEVVALFLWHGWLSTYAHASLGWMQVSYAVGFALFALLLSGAVARVWTNGHPALWRMLTVLAGAIVAAGEVSLHAYPHDLFLPIWAAALIGVSLISVAARMLPVRILNVWFDLENGK